MGVVVDDPRVILPFELSKTEFGAYKGKKHGSWMEAYHDADGSK
jgi:hypothetical protein